MSTELTPAAPFVNLFAFIMIVGGMIAAARWLDRRIGRGDYAAFPPFGPGARTIAPLPALDDVESPGSFGAVFTGIRRRPAAASSALAIDDRRAALALFGLALVCRLTFLERLPGTIAAGELGLLGTTLQIAAGQGPSLFGFDDAGQPALGSHLVAWSWQLFGETLLVERVAFSLPVACAVIPLYALLRRSVAPLPATLATLLFIGAQPVLLGRGSPTIGPLIAGSIFGAWTLSRAVGRRQPRDWALWGAALGLLCALYPFGRLVALALLVAFAAIVWFDRAAWRSVDWRGIARGSGVAALACALCLLPQVAAALRDSGVWQGPRGLLLPGVANVGFRADLAGDRWPDPVALLLGLGGLLLAVRLRRRLPLWWALLLVPLALLLAFGDGTARAGAGVVAIVPLIGFAALALDRLLLRPALQTRAAQAALLGWTIVLVGLNLTVYAVWAGGAEAMAAREPSLPTGEFWLWRDYQRSRLDAQEGLLNLREYRELPSATISERIAAARDANAEMINAQRTPPRTDLATEVRSFGTLGTDVGQFGEPRAVAVDPAGYFYVADAGRAMILKFDPSGAFVAEWPTATQFAHPWSIVVLPNGQLLVLNWETSQLARYDQSGAFLGMVLPFGEESIARGMALGGNGQLYLAQTAANRVVALPLDNLTDDAAKLVAITGANMYQQPTGAVANSRGFLFVYEPDGKRLRGFASDGRVRFTRTAPATDTINSGGLLLLPDGRLALADVAERRILLYGADGELLGSFPVAGLPQSLALTPGGQIAVVDREGGRIRLFRLAAP
jgi:hypothetical protein